MKFFLLLTLSIFSTYSNATLFEVQECSDQIGHIKFDVPVDVVINSLSKVEFDFIDQNGKLINFKTANLPLVNAAAQNGMNPEQINWTKNFGPISYHSTNCYIALSINDFAHANDVTYFWYHTKEYDPGIEFICVDKIAKTIDQKLSHSFGGARKNDSGTPTPNRACNDVRFEQ
jgi:hypothetical protein